MYGTSCSFCRGLNPGKCPPLLQRQVSPGHTGREGSWGLLKETLHPVLPRCQDSGAHHRAFLTHQIQLLQLSREIKGKKILEIRGTATGFCTSYLCLRRPHHACFYCQQPPEGPSLGTALWQWLHEELQQVSTSEEQVPWLVTEQRVWFSECTQVSKWFVLEQLLLLSKTNPIPAQLLLFLSLSWWFALQDSECFFFLTGNAPYDRPWNKRKLWQIVFFLYAYLKPCSGRSSYFHHMSLSGNLEHPLPPPAKADKASQHQNLKTHPDSGK